MKMKQFIILLTISSYIVALPQHSQPQKKGKRLTDFVDSIIVLSCFIFLKMQRV